jgi:pyruvate formate lyase activating enzyme
MDIELLAWTFNDPIVWYEFVLDTSILLKKAGIKTLYKSSHFISPEALEKLADVIDVFSVSLKSIKDEFYKQYCTGWIAPVKEALLYLHGRDDCHLEISNLMIPTINDGDTEIRNFVNWILDNLSNDIPVHFVRYHPDYKFTIPRTPEEVVSKARDIALEMGLKHVYLGNSFSHAGLNTWCSKCGEELIHRHGRRCDRLPALDQSNGSCSVCGHKVENLIL